MEKKIVIEYVIKIQISIDFQDNFLIISASTTMEKETSKTISTRSRKNKKHGNNTPLPAM